MKIIILITVFLTIFVNFSHCQIKDTLSIDASLVMPHFRELDLETSYDSVGVIFLDSILPFNTFRSNFHTYKDRFDTIQILKDTSTIYYFIPESERKKFKKIFILGKY